MLSLFVLGLLLRLPGLLFNGMSDLFELILDWGAAVHHTGLVKAFGGGYGILSYAAFGAAEAAAEWMPRFWWAPYKLMVIAVDAGVCLALLPLVRPRQQRWILVLFWLNPWFILHTAYHGFWDGPHLLLGLLAVLALRRFADERWAWAVAGALVMCGAMCKPQGLLHFAGPLILYLMVQCVRGTLRPLVFFVAGCAGVAAAAALSIRAAGGLPSALSSNYGSVTTFMPNLSNGGLGLWRFVSWVYMEWTGQPGQVHELEISAGVLAAARAVSAAICAGILLSFAVRMALSPNHTNRQTSASMGGRRFFAPVADRPPAEAALLIMTLGALTIPVFGTHAHINHVYPAMVLLTVWVVRDEVLARRWLEMVAMIGIGHFAGFRLGEADLLPPGAQSLRYLQANQLANRILELPSYYAPDLLLDFQTRVSTMPFLNARALSLLSAPVCIGACCIIWRMFRSLAERKTPGTLEATGG